jgi:small subunit ribosomal protein S6e
MAAVLKSKEEAEAYKKVVAQRQAEARELRRSLISKRRSSRKSAKVTATEPTEKKPTEKKK